MAINIVFAQAPPVFIRLTLLLFFPVAGIMYGIKALNAYRQGPSLLGVLFAVIGIVLGSIILLATAILSNVNVAP